MGLSLNSASCFWAQAWLRSSMNSLSLAGFFRAWPITRKYIIRRKGMYKHRFPKLSIFYAKIEILTKFLNCTFHSFFELCGVFSDSKSRNSTYFLMFCMFSSHFPWNSLNSVWFNSRINSYINTCLQGLRLRYRYLTQLEISLYQS